MIRCEACGQIKSKTKEHQCKGIDVRGDRRCTECNSILRNQGNERYRTICGKCSKTQWREKERQQRRELKESFGGACQDCGYAKNWAALHFHHIVPDEKYDWTPKGKGGASIREITKHPERFKLLCANCHIEHHNPQEMR